MQTLHDFIQQYTGKAGVGDTPENQGQCVGLVEKWIDNLTLPHIWGNAADLLTNADASAYTVVKNTPTNFPLPGDIVVWGPTWGGGNGHTGIVVSADPNSMQVFEQNDPTGTAPQVKQYTYSGVIGWLHPTDQAAVPTTETDLQVCLQQHDALVTQCTDLQTTITNLNTQIHQLGSQLAAKDTEVGSLQSQVTTLTAQRDSLQGQADQVITLQKLNIQAEADRTEALTRVAAAQTALAKAVVNDYTRQSPSTLFKEWLQSILGR